MKINRLKESENSETFTDSIAGRSMVEASIKKFDWLPPTLISAHEARCCKAAKEWYLGQSRAHHAINPLPAPWMRWRWRWGPLERPIHWCQIVDRHTIDCGALSALTIKSLHEVGQQAWAGQLVMNYEPDAVGGWDRLWGDHGGGYWTNGAHCYHEVVVVPGAEPGTVSVWDPTSESFMDRQALSGYESIAAIRVAFPDARPNVSYLPMTWRGFTLRFNEWCVVAR